MKLSICTDVYADLSYTEMLDKVKSLGIEAVEMTAGGWGSCAHVNTPELLASEEKRAEFLKELADRGLEIAALNCSCNQLWPAGEGPEWSESMYRCAELAGKLGVKKIVCMSGLPPANENDTTPNWITSHADQPYFLKDAVEYEWKVAVAWWKKFAAHCEAQGIEKIAIEEFPHMLVYNVETMLKLREAVGPMIGINLDPSHLMIIGAEPIASARALKGCIYHVHGKDARIEKGVSDVNGICDWKEVFVPAERAWNYVAVGCGKDLQWWKEFFSVVRMMGYNDYVSLEMEDQTMSVEAGVQTSVDALKQTLSR
ncbi:MAG: sugar phosphate isomerase/epimerase [Eubacterium sp.]|nr:sugar phosphate isomerase/epimerase [Eubacterium sp.]